jgi:hypothetical protein
VPSQPSPAGDRPPHRPSAPSTGITRSLAFLRVSVPQDAVTSARHLRFGSRHESKPQNLSRACLQACHYAVAEANLPAPRRWSQAAQSAMRSLRASATIMV